MVRSPAIALLRVVLLVLGPGAPCTAAEISGLRFLSRVRTDPESPARLVHCQQLQVGSSVVLEVRVDGLPRTAAASSARLRIVLRNESLHAELPLGHEFPAGQIRHAATDPGSAVVLHLPWMVPDDTWDLAEELVVTELTLRIEKAELRWTGELSYRLRYPPPHPGLQPLLGVWIGGGAQPGGGRSVVVDKEGSQSLGSDELVITFTLLASRARPASPVMHLLVLPRNRDPRQVWSFNRDAIHVAGEMVSDPVAGRILGTLDGDGLRIQGPAPGNPHLLQGIHVRLLDGTRLGLTATETEVGAVMAGPGTAPERRVVRRLETQLHLHER